MKISKKDANLLLILLAILIFLAGYFGIYKPYSTKAEELESQTAALRPELDELQAHYANLDTYEAGIAESYEYINDALSYFPADVRTEDLVMYAVDAESVSGMTLNAVSFTGAELLAEFSGIAEDGGSYSTLPLQGYRTSMTVDCDLTYSQFKTLMSYVNGTTMRTGLDSLSVSYNASTGALSGAVTIDKYFVANLDGQEYVPTVVPSVPLGREELFQTVEITAAEETAVTPAPEA